MPNHQRTLAVALLWASSWLASAAGVRYTVDKVWTTANGLPQNSVIAMTQTREGYLWLGTLNGLVRFDGMGRVSGAGKIRFPVFNQSNTPGLDSSTIVKLFEDSQGTLWIGTETAGVVLVSRTGKVSGVDVGLRGSHQGQLMAACEDSQGAVWLYTADGQLSRYYSNRVDVWNFPLDPNLAFSRRALLFDESGQLWVGAKTNLVALGPLPAAPGTDLPITTNQFTFRKGLDLLLGSKQGGQWRLADDRIQKWLNGRKETDWQYPWSNNVVPIAACEDLEGNLVVGTYGDDVYWFNSAGQATHVKVSHSSVVCLTVDREGCLWVGTNGGGLDRVKRQLFGVLEGTEDKTVQSVCDDHQGGLWIGYNGERIDHWSNGVIQEVSRMLPDRMRLQNQEPSFRTVFMDRTQRVWSGASAIRGQRLFELRDGRFVLAEGAQNVNQDITVIHQQRTGDLWLGTEAGLGHRESVGWKMLTTREGLSSDLIRAIADDAEGNLWVGTERGGLNRLRDGQVTVFRKQATNGLPSDDIASLYVDSEGVLWAGTSAGLARFERNAWTRYSQVEGLSSDNVGYVLEDDQGFLWLGSYAGLMRMRKKDLNDFAHKLTNSVYCRSFGEAEGLPVDECTFGSQPAACRTPDGRLWFPNIRGLVYVDPLDLRQNTNPPPVAIESVLIDGTLQHSEGLLAELPVSVTVSASSERLEIDYTSLNLAAPERARFKYRMEGHEKNWTDARNERAAHYHRLPPGTYRFEVQACNEDGVWSDRPASLAVVVLPPFWRTAWFISGMAVCLLAIVVGIVHYASTQKLQRQVAGLRQQEALERERARIARDLHDQLGANLTQVALLGELAEADKDSPLEIEAHARQISKTARDTTHALDEIVWTVNPSNDTVEGLVNYLCKYAQEYLALAGLRYRLEVPSELPATPISPEVRHNVFLAAKEAVNNVVKHAAASAAWLRLELEPTRFVLEIEDNGRGLAGSEGKHDRNGLRNMRKRMSDIEGDFIIGPGQEGGTRVRLVVPLTGPPSGMPPKNGKRL